MATSRFLSLSVLCLSLLCTTQLASSQVENRSNKIIDTARKYLYVREHGYNRGKEIEAWQKARGGLPGYPYCAYFVSAILDEAKAEAPTIRTGRAQQFLTRNRINPQHVLKGYVKLKPGYLVIWAKYRNSKNRKFIKCS